MSEFHLRFEETAIVEGSHAVRSIFVIVRNQAEGLQNGPPFQRRSPDALDQQEQAVESVLRLFGLV